MNALHAMIALSVLASAGLRAQDQSPGRKQPGELELRTDRVVVFKDGHALLTKRARGVVRDDGRLYTDEVPDSAVLGSFWASCDGSTLRSMTARWVEETVMQTVEAPCTEMRDLLRANQGRDVRLTLQWPEERQLDARIVAVLEAEPTVREPNGQQALPNGPYPSYVSIAGPTGSVEARKEGTVTSVATRPGGTFVVIEPDSGGAATGRRRVVLPVADVRAIGGAELRTMTERVERVVTTTKRLTFDFGPEAAGSEVALHLIYFTPGLRWIPTYRLDGDLEAAAGRLSLQGELLNELEDIEDAAIDLVVGVPNFRFGDVISPMSLESVMRDVLTQAAPQLMGRGNALSNALFTQRSSERRSEGLPDAAGMDMAKELAFTGEQDLFVYKVGRLTIPNGARTTVPLWSSDVAPRHVYTMDVDVVRDAAQGQRVQATGDRESPLRLSSNDVWHQLELRNTGAVPWTTGAALVTRDGLPLGQDLLTYTPPNGSTMLPITVAVDVRGDYSEREIERENNGPRWNGNQYARVVMRGTVRVTNYRGAASELRVAVGLGGKVLASDGDPDVVTRGFRAADWQNARADFRLNAHSDVTWSFRLEPGATREVWVEFEMFIR